VNAIIHYVNAWVVRLSQPRACSLVPIRRTNAITICLLFALTILLFGACEKASSPPPQPPAAKSSLRLVAFSPAIGIILRDLGHEKEIVGRHGYDSILPRTIPPCGDQAGFDYERLLAVNPTHVLTQWGSRELPSQLAALAKAHSWVVQDFPVNTVDQLRSAVTDLDRVAAPKGPSPSPAAKLLLDEMKRAFAPHGDKVFKGRVLLLASEKPLDAFGPGSMHQQILELIGGTPAIKQGDTYISLDKEKLLEINPDAIVFIAPDAAIKAGAPRDHVKAHLTSLALGDNETTLKACFRGAQMINDPEAMIPSTSMIRFADELALALEAFARR